MPVLRYKSHRFWNQKRRPFVNRRSHLLFPPINRQKFLVVDVPHTTSSEPVADALVADSDVDSTTQSFVSSSALDAISNAVYSSDSSSDSMPTVKKRTGKRVTPDPNDDSILLPAHAAESTGATAVNGHDVSVKSSDAGTRTEADASVVTNGADTGDLDFEAGSDTDDDMPEPLEPQFELKLITVDQDTSLVVADPRTFDCDPAHVTLISGCMQLQLVHGNMSVNGYELQPDRPVKGCIGGSKDFILIEGRPFSSTEESISRSIETAIKAQCAAQVIREISSFRNYPQLAVMLVMKWENTRITLIKAMLAHRLPDPRLLHNQLFFHLSFSKNYSSIGKEWMPAIQKRILNHMNDQTTVLVAGPQESGKSVLVRRIVNHIMSAEGHYGLKEKVVIVDLDPGQSEFSAPGQLTAVEVHFNDQPLISRPFVHSVLFADRVIAAVSVGAIDLTACATVFVRAVTHLMQQVKAAMDQNPCPVFISTCGFVRGLGRSLLVDLIRIISPTDVIEIKDSLDGGNDFRPEVVYGPAVVFGVHGFLTDAGSCADRKPYSYVDLKSTGRRSRRVLLNQQNRDSQVLAALSRDPQFLSLPLTLLQRIPIGLKKVIHFTDPAHFSVPAIMDKLHYAFVQLVRTDKFSSCDNQHRGLTTDLDNNSILGYGVLFVSRAPGSDEVKVEVAVTCDQAQEANCIVVPAGVSLPISLTL